MLVAKKICTGCGESKSRCDFGASTRYSSGLRSRCRFCENASNQKTYQKYRPERIERMRNWKQSPEGREWIDRYFREKSSYYVDANARRRARLAELPCDGYNRAGIFERDNWTCQLCGEPIWFVVRGLHPKAPSIDHVVPISHPDCPGDIESNVQLTHFGCNAAKNDKLLEEET